MFELRWMTEHWEGATPSGHDYVKKSDGPKLQYRTMTKPAENGYRGMVWSDWKDVPDIHIDV